MNADNTAWGSSSIVNVGDKGSLTWAVAELRSEYDDEVLEANEVYMDAMEVLTDPEAAKVKLTARKPRWPRRTLTSSLTFQPWM